MNPNFRLLVSRLVGRLEGLSVCFNFLNGREVTLPWSNRSTYYYVIKSSIKIAFLDYDF